VLGLRNSACLQRAYLYSPECMEEEFSEIRVECWSSRVHKGAAPVES
jgi:hypothetical protein